MKIIKAPNKYDLKKNEKSIFLAGSIEMGKAELWQHQLHKMIEKYDNCILFDPRRDDWNNEAIQSIKDPYFNSQVNWELDMLEKSNLIALYFDPNTKSPISLLELGLFAKSEKLTVCCPKGLWRKGNVEIICQRNNIKLFEDFPEFITDIKNKFISL
jgi:hypothetical protein